MNTTINVNTDISIQIKTVFYVYSFPYYIYYLHKLDVSCNWFK